ncbi:MAG: hypothetical protein LBI04_07910 [Treponema sp.]|jgi:hypothetical protein|nr:hypothetical protein [Treponema sp.]
MHNDFTLYYRKLPGGKRVVYYYAYDEAGVRHGGWTTGSLTLTAARKYCHRLLKEGALIPDRNKVITFGEFANGFWERGSEYVNNQDSRADITDSYINACRKVTAKQILPFFADSPLDKITVKDVNNWLLSFRERIVEKNRL